MPKFFRCFAYFLEVSFPSWLGASPQCGAAGKAAWNFLLIRPLYGERPLERTRRVPSPKICEDKAMLNLVVTLLIIALVAAVLGFGGIAVAAVGIAKIVFFVALLLFLVALLAGTMRGPRAL
jgi:uncharacterized membrane protein YtjA (UPF0391 family)